MDEEETVRSSKKQTLLKKYDIPVEHLNFEYVEKCNDEKELEKIVKILRSGEEGYYPQLVASAEARLRKLKPDSRVLRTEEPALRKETTSAEQWEAVTSEVEKWSDEMRLKERELKIAAAEAMDVSELPAVRSRAKVSASAKPASATTQSKSGQSIAPPKRSPVPRDYSAWEKYDADKELTLMEIKEQQQLEERERKRREEQAKAQRLQDEMKKAEEAAATAEPAVPANLTPTERELLATREKDKGNDFFKVADYGNAVKHYTASLKILPTPVAYNNRAIAMIKLHRYDAALKDCNEVLKVEPDNVKALMRRAIAHQNRNSYQKAYEDFNRVVELQPENRLAKSLAVQMKTKCLAKRKGVRLKIEEEGSPSQISVVSKRRATHPTEKKLENLPSSEKTWEGRQEPWKPPPLPDKILEAPWGGRMNPPLKEGVNTSWPYAPPVQGPMTDYGLPKNFCNCNGEPPFVRHPPQIICLMCHERKVLGLPPLPEGDCNCPEQKPPPKKPVANGVTSDEGTSSAKDDSNVERDKRDSEKEADETKVTDPDTNGRLRGAVSLEEEVPPVCSTPQREEAARRRNNLVPTASFLPHIPGLGSPVRMNVASKYICATKREDKSAESSSEEGGSTAGRVTRERAEEAVAAAVGRHSASGPAPARISSPYEFTRAWGGLRPDPGLEGHAAVLRAVAIEDLATVVGTKLDGQMLSLILRTLEKHFIEEPEYLAQMLHHVALLPRFSIAWAFLDSTDKAAVEKIVSALEKSGQKLTPVAEKAFQL